MSSSAVNSDANYEKLRAAIVLGEIAPNSRLVESDVVTTFAMAVGVTAGVGLGS